MQSFHPNPSHPPGWSHPHGAVKDGEASMVLDCDGEGRAVGRVYSAMAASNSSEDGKNMSCAEISNLISHTAPDETLT